MRYIGIHVSIAGDIYRALLRAKVLDINAVQIFLKNARKWKAPRYKAKDVERFHQEKGKFEDIKLFAHAGYLVNLAGRGIVLKRSYKSIIDDMRRAHSLGIHYIVVHPGNHNGKGVNYAVKRIAKSLNKIFRRMTHTDVNILLETTAGNGTSVGYRFEHIRDIIDQCSYKERIGVCLDTCHIFSAGYPIDDEEGYYRVIDDFDKTIGLDKLKLIHLNDSRGKIGSRIDKHEHIGRGVLGEESFKRILNDERLIDVPVILETPKMIGEFGPNVITKDIPMILETSRKLGFTFPDMILKEIPKKLQTSKRVALTSSEIIFRELLKTLEKSRNSLSAESRSSMKEIIKIVKESRKSGASIPEAIIKRIQQLLTEAMSRGSVISDNISRQFLKILKNTRQSVYEVDMMNLNKVYEFLKQEELVR